ncbi:MAG: hypothetical protein R6W96_01080 [Clostridia bacterium]
MRPAQEKFSFKTFYIGFTLLAATTLLLFGLSAGTALADMVLPGLVLLLSLAGMLHTLRGELVDNLRSLKKEIPFSMENILLFTAVAGGAVITYGISIYGGLGPVVASGLIGVAAAILLPRHAVAIFCGSFAGMSSNLLLPPGSLFLAGVISGIVYILARNVLVGFGGKLGTIAFTGCVIAALATGRTITGIAVAGWEEGLLLVLFSVLGGVATYSMAVRLKMSSVLASGLVGVFAGVVLPLVFPETGNSLAVMVFCASFMGMSSPERMRNEIFIALAGIFAGLAFIYSAPWQGAGGKLGTIAFGSVLAVRGFMDMASGIKAKLSNRRIPTTRE